MELLPAAGEVLIEGDEHHYLFRVRRLAVGDAVVVTDATGREADARVLSVDATRARLSIQGVPRDAMRRAPRITVLQSLIKGERMDWCIEKLAECGADEIVLVAAARSVVKLEPQRAESRRARLDAMARAAARQSQQPVPEVRGPFAIASALADVSADVRLVCHPQARESPLRAPAHAREIAILVGPEGGLAPEELEAALAHGFAPVSLGAGVLRAETAGPVACAAIRLGAVKS
ncbi:MAG TPA: RsmE family RNA methyltransferase [Kofleriaceae bacterium]|nr:RsmE family RNA methyltransferase [Kofleriaceae bacterium]